MSQTPDQAPDNATTSAATPSFGRQTPFRLTNLDIQEKLAFSFPSPGVTAIVGGNNAGKSTLLRQIYAAVGHNPTGFPYVIPQPTLVTAVRYERGLDSEGLLQWLGKHSAKIQDSSGYAYARFNSDRISEPAAGVFWQDTGLAALRDHFLHYAPAETRFAWTAPVGRRNLATDPPSHPLHSLEDNPEAFGRLSRFSERMFGTPLVLDLLGGSLAIRVGHPGIEAPPIDRITTEYRDAMGRLPLLSEQGDGMRSALGMLIPILATTYSTVMIDEPEAFLHPPQARLLGLALAELATDLGIQVVLATHDRNILAGILDRPQAEVSVVRLTRRNTETQARELAPAELRTIWNNPALKYTNVLDGLFHQLVVLAENEIDCRFYAAALEAAHESEALQILPHDVLFIPTNGKTGMASIARTLRATGVRVIASPDLDVLNDEVVATRLLESLGGDWSSVRELYRKATQEFQRARAPRNNAQVLQAIEAVLRPEPTAIYTSKTQKDITAHLYVESEWKRLKDFGVAAFRQDAVSGDALLAALAKQGLVAVQVGELERFAPRVQVGKGVGWLEQALLDDAHKSPEARKHVLALLDSF